MNPVEWTFIERLYYPAHTVLLIVNEEGEIMFHERKMVNG
jgi:hypothetical protein